MGSGAAEERAFRRERPERRLGADLDDHVRGALAETPDIVAEACLKRPERATLESLDEAPHEPESVLERQPRIALTPLAAGRELDPSARDAQRRHAAGIAAHAARRQQRVKEREPECRIDGFGPEVAVETLEDRREADELAWRMQIEDLVDEPVIAVERREALVEKAPGVSMGLGRGRSLEVGVVNRRVTLLAAADLVAAERAPEMLAHGNGAAGLHGKRMARGGRSGRTLAGGRFPDELVGDDRPAARWAVRREQVADEQLQARLAAWCGRDRLERGVEVADVRRPEDDLCHEPRQRARLERDGAALPVHGGTGDPAAAAVEVDDDVTGRRERLDVRSEELGGRGGSDPLDRREREAGFRAQKDVAAGHGAIVPEHPRAPTGRSCARGATGWTGGRCP